LNGADDKHIATVDEEGVALAAIQGLNRKVESENAALRSENAELRARLERLEEELGRPKEAVRDSH
jgi:regulator of replication initiation timing